MKLTNLCFSYGEKTILDHFSLELPDTGVTALAGPSGCGKTTLLRILGGLEKPLSGTLDIPPAHQTAFLFQENRLLPGLPAAEQIRVILPRGGDPLPWLDAVGLAKEAETLPGELSGGMQRRVALARCLAYGQDKGLFLLDEPFTGIDPARARSLMDFLRSLDVPVLCTAHDAETLVLADLIIRLEGPPLALTATSRSR
ncbi:MAG: ATP-binding cassette domain-containing protein, partial [Lachnospiraceae bacterium]|nr:ATP-binding cassette domain-containing protein [Lachnospiraceae bacterium]